jgi:hypothetical protein
MELFEPTAWSMQATVANMGITVQSTAGFLGVIRANFVAVAVAAALAQPITVGSAQMLFLANTMAFAPHIESIVGFGAHDTISLEFL